MLMHTDMLNVLKQCCWHTWLSEISVNAYFNLPNVCVCVCACAHMCVCVCVKERERARDSSVSSFS